MAYEFIHSRQVEFHETDLAGIVHFSNFFRYMEAAEHAFFRSLGLSIHQRYGGKTIGWPRIRAECTYYNPLKLEDLVETHLWVTEIGSRKISYGFVLRRVNVDPPVEAAKGSFTNICVAFDDRDGTMESVPIPDEILEKIEVAPGGKTKGVRT